MSIDHLKAYREGRANGSIPAPIPKTPLERLKEHPRSLRLAITAFCFDCCGFNRTEVTLCAHTECPLYNLRPYQKKENQNET